MGILTVGGALRRGHDDAGMAATVARGRAPDYGFAFSAAVSKSVFFASLVIAAKVATIVCVIELAIMLVFSVLPFAPQGVAAAMLDAILLALITAPLILLWVIRPYIAARHLAYEQLANMNRMLRREIDERMAAEEKLRAREYDLERQIQEIDYVKQLVEEQAANAVGIAEDLAAQKQAVEQSERRNEYLANHDTLTGLPNRRHFEQRLTQLKEAAQATDGAVMLIFVDLDNFKAVNDTLGHQRGDDLLVQVAAQLRASVRAGEFVARLGGDEFAVVSTQFRPRRDAELERVAERIRSALAISIAAATGVIPVRATLGIATYPADAADEQVLLRCADRAMYAAKERGRNCVVFYHDLESATAGH